MKTTRFFLVEPNYYKFRIMVEAKFPYDARHKVKRWLFENKHIYIMNHELEVKMIYNPMTVKNIDW